MRQRDWLIGAGLAAFAIGILALFPAHVALRVIAPEAAATGSRGTLWSGSAETLTIGALRLGRTQWSWRPLAVLRLQISADVSATWPGGKGQGRVAAGIGGLLVCEDCRTTSRLDFLRPLARVPAIAGNVEVDIDQLEITGGWPRRVVGIARLKDMPLILPGQASAVAGSATGSYEVSFKADPVPEAGMIEGVVTDIDGPLQVAARLQLMPPGNYQLAGAVQARPGAHENLTAGLALLGPQRGDGGYEFSFAGSL
jgi:hypothetical protein